MAARTFDQVVTDAVGLKEMTILRLVFQLEEAREQLEAAHRQLTELQDGQKTPSDNCVALSSHSTATRVA